MDNKTTQKLFYEILRIRMVEEEIASEYKNAQMRCPVHLSIGQEAIACGVSANLNSNDIVFSNHRSHSHYLAKGGSLPRMIAEIYGKAAGCSKGRGGSQHLIDLSVNFMGATPIVGETIPICAGTAFAGVMQNKKKRVSVVFFGDAAMEEGVVHESLNFASLKKLPVLFVCENNLYSISTHIRDRQPNREIYKVALGHGISSYQEDGNDILKVFKLAGDVIQDIKKGKGPGFIEFATYRIREHVGPDYDPDTVRPQKEQDKWKEKDPVHKLEKHLLENNIMDKNDMEAIKNKISREIKNAFDFAKKSPFPDEKFSEKLVYA